MSGSLSVAVRRAVTGGLAAHFQGLSSFNDQAGDREVEVTYRPDRRTKTAQRVYAGSSTFEHDPAGLRPGRNFRDEAGSFELVVLVELPGCDEEEAEERASEIGVACEEWVADRKNNELGIDGLLTLTCRGGRTDSGPTDSGAGALLILNIAWTARLT